MRLLVIDGNSIVNRAFYGIKLLTTKDGQFTNGIFGFMNILLRLKEECEPDHVAIAFDLHAPTFRHKLYDGYKAGRKGMPPELRSQMPLLKELLCDLGYAIVEQEGFEVERGTDGIETAFTARFGSGRPYIGILAEYDALSGLSQEEETPQQKFNTLLDLVMISVIGTSPRFLPVVFDL